MPYINIDCIRLFNSASQFHCVYDYLNFTFNSIHSDDFEIIIVNIVNQDDIFDTLKTLTNNEFTYVQDTPALNIWNSMNAKKDDIMIFKRDGTRKVHLSMSNKRKEIFLGPKDGASCEIVDQVKPM